MEKLNKNPDLARNSQLTNNFTKSGFDIILISEGKDFSKITHYLLSVLLSALHSVAACIDRKIGHFRFRAFFEKSR